MAIHDNREDLDKHNAMMAKVQAKIAKKSVKKD